MKETPHKKNTTLQALQNKLPPSLKPREVTVVKHYHPNPGTRCIGELPEGNRYLHLHPVFKFVDNFLSSTPVVNNNNNKSSLVGRSAGIINKKVFTKPMTKCECNMPSNAVVVSGEIPRTFVTKRSNIPQQACTVLKGKQDRLKTNLNNMSSNSNLRVSLRSLQCPNCHCSEGTQMSPKVMCTPKTPATPDSENYILQLKNEIEQNKAHFEHLKIKNDNNEYVSKLKEELLFKRTKCLEDARNIINELQSEIHNYRLQAKPKYSSSCSNIGSGDRVLVVGPQVPFKKTGESSFQRWKRPGEIQGDHAHPIITGPPKQEKPIR